MLCPVAARARLANLPAVEYLNAVLSYKQFHEHISSIASFLRSLNLPKHARVAFVAEPNLNTVALFFALWRLEMIACPLSTRFPEQLIKSATDRLGATVRLTPSKICFEKEKYKEHLLNPQALATYLFTSGTTKEPKIAAHTIDNHLQNSFSAIEALKILPGDRYFLTLPLHHVGGIAILWRTFISGATLIIGNNKTSLDGFTHVSYVPTQLYRLLEENSIQLEYARKSKCLLLGGAPISQTLYQRAEANDLKISTSYGMTEMSSLVALNGYIMPHVHAKIVEGEIYVQGRALFQGYLTTPDQIELPLNEGWFATGDLGIVVEKKLKVLGRKDSLIISGGENIQPAEIEAVLLELPDIEQALVGAANDPEFGAVCQAYVFSPKKKWDELSLKNALRERLPSYKIPKKIFFLDRLYEKDEIKFLAKSL